MTSLVTFLGTAASLGAAVALIDGFDFDGAVWKFLVVAAIVGLANAVVKPILQLVSLPLIVLSLGFFLIIVNALVLQIVVWIAGPDMLDLGLTSDGFFWSTFWASIVISVVGWILGILLPDRGGLRATT